MLIEPQSIGGGNFLANNGLRLKSHKAIWEFNRYLHGFCSIEVREAEKTNIPFMAALPGALRRCSSLVWLATLRSERLALHPASAPKNGILTISASLSAQLHHITAHYQPRSQCR